MLIVYFVARVSNAENLPVENNTVDLVTVCTALHWFDIPKFYTEVGGAIRRFFTYLWDVIMFSNSKLNKP